MNIHDLQAVSSRRANQALPGVYYYLNVCGRYVLICAIRYRYLRNKHIDAIDFVCALVCRSTETDCTGSYVQRNDYVVIDERDFG